MTSLNTIAWDDTVLPFQLDASDIRGRVARLDGSLNRILGQHAYPPVVEALVAEMVLLTALVGQTIKLRWKLSLQVQSNGPVRMIATDYLAPETEGEAARIRAYASFDADKLTGDAPMAQLGSGYFAVLIDQGPGTEPYQGITALTGPTLSQCAEAYFDQSEQLPTRFRLSFGRSTEADGLEHWRAGGIMIQQLPESSRRDDQDGWNRVGILLDTTEDLELIGPSLAPTDLLYRLFHEESPRVYDAQSVQFGCTCSEERVRSSLSIYSARDIAKMTTPEGRVTADCQFCGAHYDLDPASVGFDAKEGARDD